jgi:hypothetical protein
MQMGQFMSNCATALAALAALARWGFYKNAVYPCSSHTQLLEMANFALYSLLPQLSSPV